MTRPELAAMFDGLVYEVFSREARALTAGEVIALVAAEWGSHDAAAFQRRIYRSLLRLAARGTVMHHRGSDLTEAVYVPAWMWRRWLRANSYTPLEVCHEAAATPMLRGTGWRCDVRRRQGLRGPRRLAPVQALRVRRGAVLVARRRRDRAGDGDRGPSRGGGVPHA